MFAWSKGSTLPKLKEDNSQYYPVFFGGGGEEESVTNLYT